MPFCSAKRRAAGSGRVLKPMMIARDAVARLTSDSEIAPVPVWITRICTSVCLVLSCPSECSIAPIEPLTSAFKITFRSLT